MAGSKVLDPPVVTVRFRPGQGPPFDSSATSAMPSLPNTNWANLDAMFPGLTILPLFRTATTTQVQALVTAAEQLTPTYVSPRFTEMFRIHLPKKNTWAPGTPSDSQDPQQAKKLRDIMSAHLPIDRVAVELRRSFGPAVTDGGGVKPYEMHHLDLPPKGIGVEEVWSGTDGQGLDETLTDVERAWDEDHVEFKNGGVPITAAIPGNTPSLIHDDIAHGTCALAVALARKNAEWGVGAAPRTSEALLASVYVDADEDNIPDAIFRALLELIKRPPGSVMLLEVESELASLVPDEVDSTIPPDVWGPCEINVFCFDMIQLAVALHVIVVEAAGNADSNAVGSAGTGFDFDDHPPGIFHGDSGAILVGASCWKPDTPSAYDDPNGRHQAMEWFCHGDKIHCFAWGYEVATGSVDTAGAALFTAGWGGTSAASAIIAGAALVVQSLFRKSYGTYLPPLQMRMLLGDRTLGFNTPLREIGTGGAPDKFITDTVGVMPNLKHIADALGLLPDLYIRDNVDDDGGIHDGLLSASPDIIVKTTPLTTTPDEAFGADSGTQSDLELSESPVHGGQTEIYVRVRNRGGVTAEKATVTVYRANSGTILLPPDWTQLGTAEVTVPVGAIVVAGPIVWDPVDVEGHHCFIATVHHDQDGFLKPNDLLTWDLFRAVVRNANNVAWRNFDVVVMDDAAAMAEMVADMTGPGEGGDQDAEMRVVSNLPRDAKLEIELPESVADRMSLPRRLYVRHTVDRKRVVRGPLTPHGVSRLGLVRLSAGERHRVRLRVDIAKKHRKRKYEIALVQLHRGVPLGRFTWRLVPKKGN